MGKTQILGTVAIVPKGDWQENTSYELLNLIRYEGASYLAIRNVPENTLPTDVNYWQLVVTDGQQGPQGPQGDFAAVDSGLSTESENPVQNKVIAEAIGNIENSLNNFNLENGEGQDSIIQKYSGEVDATHKGNTNTGESAAVFGEFNNNTGNRTHIAGKMNDSQAGNSVIGGLGNGRGIEADPNLEPLQGSNITVGGLRNQNRQQSKSPDNVILSGDQNKNTDSQNVIESGYFNENTRSDNSTINGFTNTNTDSPNTVMGGRGNKNTNSSNVMMGGLDNTCDNGSETIIGGRNNKIENGIRNIIGGGWNRIFNASDNIIGGYGNEARQQAGITGGKHNKNWTKCGIVAGNYNKPSVDNLLELGNGTDNDHRSNAFEVTKDGVARAYGTPSGDNDLVRVQDLPKLYRHELVLTIDKTSNSNSYAPLDDYNELRCVFLSTDDTPITKTNASTSVGQWLGSPCFYMTLSSLFIKDCYGALNYDSRWRMWYFIGKMKDSLAWSSSIDPSDTTGSFSITEKSIAIVFDCTTIIDSVTIV